MSDENTTREPLMEGDAAAMGRVVESCRGSVVQVIREGRLRATGFFVDHAGRVVTIAHVVRELGQAFTIRMIDGATYPGEAVHVDRRHDLAVLRTEAPEPRPLPLATGEEVTVHTRVAAIGHSADLYWTVEAGTVKAPAAGSGPMWTKTISVAMKAMPGFSGAPVLDGRGRVIGVLAAFTPDRETSFVIPGDAVAEMLSRIVDDDPG